MLMVPKCPRPDHRYRTITVNMRGDYSQGMTICDSPLISVIGLLQPQPLPYEINL